MTTPTPDMATLLAAYQKVQQEKEKRRAYLQTEEGKEKNRIRAAIYYDRHREQVLEKRHQRYQENQEELKQKSRDYARKKKESQATQESKVEDRNEVRQQRIEDYLQ